jgi:hypothetical protein
MEITRLSYAEESANLSSLIKDMDMPDITTHIDNIPMFRTLIDNLKSKVDAFDKKVLELTSKKAYIKDEKPAYILSKELRDYINNKLIRYIDTMYDMEQNKYGEFHKRLSVIVDDINEVVKRRRNHKLS